MVARRGPVKRWWLKFFGLEGVDKWLLLAAGGLLIFGLVMLISASSVVAYKDFHDSLYYFKRQSIATVAGLVLFFLAANWPKEKLKKHSWWLLLFNIALLVVVLFFKFVLNEERNGAGAWIPFFGFNIQPSEWVKPAFILYLAARLSDSTANLRQDLKIVPFLVIYGIIAFLILLQPDMGTLIIITAAGMLVLFLANAPLKQLTTITAIGLALFAVLVSFSSHQRERFHCLIDVNYSPQDKCYQLEQSLIAIGSGGWFGRGLGESRQKFLYLPEVQNDFIYAVIAEEMGLIIAIALVALYAFIFYRAYLIAKKSHDPFIKLLALGIGGWLFFQAILNIGGVVRILPMTGVPLPLISYGGSAMLASLAGIGLLVNLSRK